LFIDIAEIFKNHIENLHDEVALPYHAKFSSLGLSCLSQEMVV
jgi:hypothetical protein